LGLDDNFFDIGGHSLLAVQAVRAVEKESGHACSLPDLFAAPTVRALSALLPTARSSRIAPMVIPLRSEGNDTTVFCICGIHLYQELADQLAPRMPVVGIFLPCEEAFYRSDPSPAAAPSVEEMAAQYLVALRAAQPHGPYRLLGVSFGGVLAFEIAQQLLAAGERVECLAMLDSMLPRALRRNWGRWAMEHWSRARRGGWRSIAVRVARRFDGGLGASGGDPSRSDESARLEEIRQTIYRAATSRYLPRPYPGAALLVRATDPGFFKSDIADRSYGWGNIVRDLQFADVTGDHLSILRIPNVQALAAAVAAEIARGAPSAPRPSPVAAQAMQPAG
jgi:thioesterase domain-containing protein